MWMGRIHPPDRLRLLHRLNIWQIDGNSLSITPRKHTPQLLILGCIDLLMRHIRRYINKVSWSRLRDKLELLSPSHARFAADHVDDAFEVAVVVGAGFGVGVDSYGASPELLCAGAGEGYGGFAVHTWSLGGVAI